MKKFKIMRQIVELQRIKDRLISMYESNLLEMSDFDRALMHVDNLMTIRLNLINSIN